MESERSQVDDRACSYAARIQALAQQEALDNLAAQSVVVAALKTLERALRQERQVAAAAISMAQQTRLHDMTRTLEETAAALRALLTDQGIALLKLPAPREVTPESPDSWWFALTEAIQALEEGTARIASIASGQPKGGPVRMLSSIITRLLHNHHNHLLHEAEQWMT